MYMCVYIYIYRYACMYVCIYIYIYIYIYILCYNIINYNTHSTKLIGGGRGPPVHLTLGQLAVCHHGRGTGVCEQNTPFTRALAV